MRGRMTAGELTCGVELLLISLVATTGVDFEVGVEAEEAGSSV